MLNLLVNSLDALEAKKPGEGRIDVKLGLFGDDVAIVVQDNGAGVSPSELPRVADLFYTTKDVGRGTGLGLALVHAIGRKDGPDATKGWVNRYIFPDGYSPALSETMTAIEGARLWVTDIEIWRLHYAETLRNWDERFQANRARAAELLGERFCRMWEFYLIAAEFSFRYGKHMVAQVQLTRQVDTLPLSRDYMLRCEEQLEAAERPA